MHPYRRYYSFPLLLLELAQTSSTLPLQILRASGLAERNPPNSRGKLGMTFMLDTGPSLYVANGILPSIKPTTGGEEMSFNYIRIVELKVARKD